MPLIETRGAASAQGFGEFAKSSEPVYVESCFSTYLYAGNDSTQTITNGIDLAGDGGLVWSKQRTGTQVHVLVDTVRGNNKRLQSNSTAAEDTTSSLMSFNSDGYGIPNSYGILNSSGHNYASWTFREQAKFFDVVTYTGDGVNGRTISHNLGSVPGCMIVKCTSATGDWYVWHVGAGAYVNLLLNSTGATVSDRVNTPTLTGFNVQLEGNTNGATYVAYLFADDAGGFGLNGTDNVISCGSYTGNGSTTGPVVDLGYEPQWVMVKQSSASGQWWNMIDVMRGFDVSTGAQTLGANASDAEYTNAGFGSGTPIMSPTATGFQVRSAQSATNASGATYIYIAIRRGPMKVPTSGTSVFAPTKQTSTGYTQITGLNFAPDFVLQKAASSADNWDVVDKLRGPFVALRTNTTDAESASDTQYFLGGWLNDGVKMGSDPSGQFNGWNPNSISFFRRAPGFFDVVCYTGTNPAQTLSHNLAAVPELIIVKRRLYADNWPVYSAALGNQTRLILNLTDAQYAPPTSVFWDSTTPTATTFTVGTFSEMNGAGNTFVAYLFATCAGVSKVGSYTGTGTTQTINCGFTAGARFVLVKRTDSTGNWLVADSARGIVAGNDPLLYLNSTAAEITTLDWIDADSSGFIVNQEATANANVNAASYIYFAVS